MLSRKEIESRLLIAMLLFTVFGRALPQIAGPPEVLTIEDGLSQGYVTSILQDSEGFLWIGTRNGLNRYDGYQFKVFTHDALNSFSLAGNCILALHEIGDYLFIGTLKNGLNVFHKKANRFFRLHADGELDRWLKEGNFSDLLSDKQGRLWCRIETPERKILIAKFALAEQLTGKDTQHLEVIHSETWEVGELGPLYRRAESNKIWGNSAGKLYSIDTETGDRHFYDPPFQTLEKVNPTSDEGVWYSGGGGIGRFDGKNWQWLVRDVHVREMLFLEQEKQLLVATRDGDLFRFNKPDSLSRLLHGEKIWSLPVGKVAVLFRDRSGIVWIGTNGYGIVKINPRLERFTTQFPGESVMTPVLVDGRGNFGIVSAKGDSWFVSSPGHAFQNFPGGLNARIIMRTGPDGSDWLLSTQGEQAVLYQKNQTGGIWKQVLTLPGKKSIIPYEFGDFAFDPYGNVWIALPKRLIKFHPHNEELARFSYEKVLPEQHEVNGMARTADGSWWIATDRGLAHALPDGKDFRFKLLRVEPGRYEGIPTNEVATLLTSPQDEHVLWIGTMGGGLSRLDTRTMKFTHFNTRNGLPNDVIYSILPDAEGRLWMSSNKGIIRLNPATGIIKNYTVEDGLPTNEFNQRAYGKSPDGTLYFGGVKGLVSFHPEQFFDNPVAPAVRFTGLEVNNRPVRHGDSTNILGKAIEFTESIELPFSKNSLTLEFAALEFSVPTKNRFRYYLDGAEPEWAHEASERKASYLNLPPGKYTFFIKSCNSDGVWSETPTELKITILPPWYRTTAAYVAYALLLIVFAYGIMRFFLYRQRLRHELVLEQKEAERLKELDAFKSRLYTNITHEFRTPLTVIQGMAKEVTKAKSQSKLNHAGKLIERNGASLLRLINQILDLAKLEAKSLKLNPIHADLIGFVKYLAGSFESLAAVKDIELHFHSEKESIYMAIDKERMQTIVSNLLSNAIKFTPANGDIDIRITVANKWEKFFDRSHFLSVSPAAGHGGDWVFLTIKDNGTGIPADGLPHVFDRFYQTDNRESRLNEGTGIGLALVKELVQLMEGALAVKSEEGVGTAFTLVLPIIRGEEREVRNEERGVRSEETGNGQDDVFSGFPTMPDSSPLTSLPSLLIIEDNADVAQYLVTCVEETYEVLLARNGKEGIEKALETVPDLIVSDVMMPEKDGFEVVDTLKNDERTSHIPIVLLTAKADASSRIEGLERGADAYLSKPFDKVELLVRLRKLLELRLKLQKRYSGLSLRDGRPDVKKTGTTPVQYEDNFILKVQTTLEENLDDENFGVVELCRALSMSRTQLHNKIKALTGKSTTHYIRFLRLQKARQLLLSSDKTVSEIAFEVGFRHLQHFSTSFTEEFGKPPSKLR